MLENLEPHELSSLTTLIGSVVALLGVTGMGIATIWATAKRARDDRFAEGVERLMDAIEVSFLKLSLQQQTIRSAMKERDPTKRATLLIDAHDLGLGQVQTLQSLFAPQESELMEAIIESGSEAFTAYFDFYDAAVFHPDKVQASNAKHATANGKLMQDLSKLSKAVPKLFANRKVV